MNHRTFTLYTFVLILSLSCCSWLSAQENSIQWLTWEEAIEKSKTDKKKIFVDIYANWCDWCKKMDSTSFQNVEVISYINENFHAVRFDGETKEDITFNGKVYKYIKSGRRGYHELSAWMSNGKISYPTVVFFDENQKIQQHIPGYLPAQKLKPLVTYYGDNHNKKTPWEAYKKTIMAQKEKEQTEMDAQKGN